MGQPWLFIVTVVGMCLGAGIIRSAMVSRGRGRMSVERQDLNAKRFEKTFEERLKKIEDRLANMETLVLEQEKERKFDAL